jgi:hypothetical protein
MGRLVLHWVCVYALVAVPLVGCSEETAATGGSGGSGGTGGDRGTGGVGGGPSGACTNAEDTAVLETLMYTNDNGTLSEGPSAAGAIAGECPFGEPPRCGAELLDVVGDNNPDNAAALADCVVVCMSAQVDLTSECVDCYGDVITCAAVNCVSECVDGAFTQDCVMCRIDNNCNSDFEECSGIPSDVVAGGISCIDGEPTVTLFAKIRDRDLDQDLEGVRVCETDTDNCQVTNADGRAPIELPCEQEVSYTFEKEGYVSGLWLDVTDETFQGFSYPMISDAQLEEDLEILMIPNPPMGGAVFLLAIGGNPGVTFDLVDETAQVFYLDEDGTPNPDLTATTSPALGGFFEVPPGEYQIEFGGNATNCVPRAAWPGDAPNRTKVPIKAGFITFAAMACDPQ